MPPIPVEGAPPIDYPVKRPWIPDVGVGKTGCPGGVHPVAVVVDPIEDQAVAMGSPNEGIPIECRPLACEVTW